MAFRGSVPKVICNVANSGYSAHGLGHYDVLAIRRDEMIVRQELHAVDARLGNQQSIKRVAVNRWQSTNRHGSIEIDLEFLESGREELAFSCEHLGDLGVHRVELLVEVLGELILPFCAAEAKS